MRTRVEAAVARLGYVAHGAAWAPASRRSHAIGAIVPTIDNAIFAAGIHGLQRRLDSHGHTLLLTSTEYDSDREMREVRALNERGVDRVMLFGSPQAPEISAMLAAARVPNAAVWTNDPACPFPTIGFDNRSAMKRLVADLWDLGHRRFGMIAGITAGNDRARARVEGFRAGREAFRSLRTRAHEMAGAPPMHSSGPSATRRRYARSSSRSS